MNNYVLSLFINKLMTKIVPKYISNHDKNIWFMYDKMFVYE